MYSVNLVKFENNEYKYMYNEFEILMKVNLILFIFW